MVYVATRREQWSAPQTGVKFFGTTLLLGSALVFLVSTWTGRSHAPALPGLIIAVALVKAALEAWSLSRKHDRRYSALRRVALVMLGDLRQVTITRFALLLLGGILAPLIALYGTVANGARATSVFILCALIAAEACERYLFFRSAPASRMPGGLP
jgi:DMSO reductase anchor subunit